MIGDRETAYAKINLALHVRERMPDGYHRIETLFAFCEDGDVIEVAPDDGHSLTVTGQMAGELVAGPDNLVLAAACLMKGFESFFGKRSFPGAALRLDKRLPVAAGLGGGSADAGATIRLLNRFWNAGVDTHDLCLSSAHLGADVPACIVSQTRLGTGTGTELHMAGLNDAAGLHVLLVNPRVPLATGPVFQSWDGVDRGPLGDGSVMEAALGGRNDLEAPAIALCPPIANVLASLGDTHPRLARMSGSGATCFALYDDARSRDAADAKIASIRPDWWRMRSRLR